MGSSPFARRYLGNRFYFLFLRVLRCFSSPGALLMDYLFHPSVTGHYPSRVPPFGYPRLNACLRLLVAFRSLPRPSSADGALASTLCPSSLDLLSSFPETFSFPLTGLALPSIAFAFFIVRFSRCASRQSLKTIQVFFKRRLLFVPFASLPKRFLPRPFSVRVRPRFRFRIPASAYSLERR